MEQSTQLGAAGGLDATLQSLLGESLLGIGVNTISVSAFVCGVALFYLVMARTLRRKSEADDLHAPAE